MTSFTTFYVSQVIGKKLYDDNGNFVGIVKDLLMDANKSQHTSERPFLIGIKIKNKNEFIYYSSEGFSIEKKNGKIKIFVARTIELTELDMQKYFSIKTFLDKQIVDLNGKKLVRVNDVRLVTLTYGTFVLAVDIGIEGLLRRIGIVTPVKYIFMLLGIKIPSKFILWDDVAAIDFSRQNIKLSKSYAKLQTLHPSDLADIIEDMGKKASASIFSALDEERAADVLEELEPNTQVHIVESLPIEKAADVLEKMPSDEVADILDELEDDKVELLLNEMEKDTSQEVRELLSYPVNSVGSIMSTDVMTFKEDDTVEDVLRQLRTEKPEYERMYNLFVTNDKNNLIATFSLRDLVISSPDTKISQIMKPALVSLLDYQDLDDVAEIVSKYNLLAIPVVNNNDELEGMIVIDDVIDDLINKRRTNK